MSNFTYQLVPNQTHTYAFTIESIGQKQLLRSNNLPPHTSLGAGTMTVTVGSIQQTVTIDSTNDHIDGIAAAITNVGYLHLQASYAIIDPDNGYIQIESYNAGTDWLPSLSFDLTVDNGISQLSFSSGAAGDNGFSSFVDSPNSFWTEMSKASTAAVTFNGNLFTYDTNTITDLIPGYSLIIGEGTNVVTVPQISN